MKELGYKNNNAILNLGTLFVFVMLYIFKVLCVVPVIWLYTFITGKGKGVLDWFIHKMFYSEIIIILIEGFMEFLISGYLNAVDPLFHTSKSGDVVSVYVGYFSLFKTIILMPGLFIYLFTRPMS